MDMDCRVCQPAREAYAEGPSMVTPWHLLWACDEPRAEEEGPLLTIDCPACGASPTGDCSHCDHGQYPIYRCPMKLLGPAETRDVQDFALLRLGILPSTGGFMDQSAAWVAKMSHMQATAGMIEEKRIKKAEAARKRAVGTRAR